VHPKKLAQLQKQEIHKLWKSYSFGCVEDEEKGDKDSEMKFHFSI
jgi:hypothetical protein